MMRLELQGMASQAHRTLFSKDSSVGEISYSIGSIIHESASENKKGSETERQEGTACSLFAL